MSAKLPIHVERRLARVTADRLGAPHLVCGYRRCRRSGCRMHFVDTGEPCCLSNLDARSRQLFEALRDEARHVIDHAVFDTEIVLPLLRPPPPDVPEHWLREEAIAVAWTIVPAREIRYWKKRRGAVLAAAGRMPP